MLEGDYFTEKSQELLNSLLVEIENKKAPKNEQGKIVSEDLEFLRKLTKYPEGSKHVMKQPYEKIKIIPNLVAIIESDASEHDKLTAIQILKNLLKNTEN